MGVKPALLSFYSSGGALKLLRSLPSPVPSSHPSCHLCSKSGARSKAPGPCLPHGEGTRSLQASRAALHSKHLKMARSQLCGVTETWCSYGLYLVTSCRQGLLIKASALWRATLQANKAQERISIFLFPHNSFFHSLLPPPLAVKEQNSRTSTFH